MSLWNDRLKKNLPGEDPVWKTLISERDSSFCHIFIIHILPGFGWSLWYRLLCEFKFYHSDSAETKLEFAVQIKSSGGFNGEHLYFGVRQGREIFFLSSKSLYVYSNDTFVREDNKIAHCLVLADEFFTGDEKRRDHLFVCKSVCLFHFYVTSIFKIIIRKPLPFLNI